MKELGDSMAVPFLKPLFYRFVRALTTPQSWRSGTMLVIADELIARGRSEGKK